MKTFLDDLITLLDYSCADEWHDYKDRHGIDDDDEAWEAARTDDVHVFGCIVRLYENLNVKE